MELAASRDGVRREAVATQYSKDALVAEDGSVAAMLTV